MTLKQLLLLVNVDNWIDFVALVIENMSFLLLMLVVIVAELLVAVLIVKTLPLISALQFVARRKGAVFPAVIAQRGMRRMFDKMALEYVKPVTSLLIAVVVDALFSMSAKTIMKWQLVGIPMFVVLLFVSVLILPLTAAVAPVLSPPNTDEIIVTKIPQMFVEMLTLLAY